jgi:Uma2 family endonuclease
MHLDQILYTTLGKKGKNFMTNKDNFIKETGLKYRDNKVYTYGDYLSWNDDHRYELIDGVVYIMAPSPLRSHQKISGAIHNQLYNYLLNRKCEVYAAPFDIRLPDEEEDDNDIKTVIQPDLAVICDLNKLDKYGCKGAPDIIVEIVSPSSEDRDRKVKRDLYEKHGVIEYWIFDDSKKTVEVYLLNSNGHYDKSDLYTANDKLSSTIFVDLEIDLKEIFNQMGG